MAHLFDLGVHGCHAVEVDRHVDGVGVHTDLDGARLVGPGPLRVDHLGDLHGVAGREDALSLVGRLGRGLQRPEDLGAWGGHPAAPRSPPAFPMY
eukprot:scaffold472806_cov26-Prasinocladus_malaysianus.AAC.1